MLSVDYLPVSKGAYLRLTGSLTERSCDVLVCMLEQTIRHKGPHAVLDLCRVRRIDEAGRKTLRHSRHRMVELGGSLQLLGLEDERPGSSLRS